MQWLHERKAEYSYPERSDDKLAAGEALPKATTTVRERNSIARCYYQKSAEAIVVKETSSDKIGEDSQLAKG